MSSQTSPETKSLSDDLRLARTVAGVAADTRGVASLGGGRFAQAATYGPGETVRGVVVSPEGVRVHVIASYPGGFPLPELSDRLRARISEHVRDLEVSIVFEDLEEEES